MFSTGLCQKAISKPECVFSRRFSLYYRYNSGKQTRNCHARQAVMNLLLIKNRKRGHENKGELNLAQLSWGSYIFSYVKSKSLSFFKIFFRILFCQVFTVTVALNRCQYFIPSYPSFTVLLRFTGSAD